MGPGICDSNKRPGDGEATGGGVEVGEQLMWIQGSTQICRFQDSGFLKLPRIFGQSLNIRLTGSMFMVSQSIKGWVLEALFLKIKY